MDEFVTFYDAIKFKTAPEEAFPAKTVSSPEPMPG